jgi:hypothetical protein
VPDMVRRISRAASYTPGEVFPGSTGPIEVALTVAGTTHYLDEAEWLVAA